MIRFEDIADKLRQNYAKADIALLQRAYVFSAKEHADQFRKSGEPYLAHPLEVANILADMGLDVITVTVGLLHDVVEDTLTDLSTVEKLFGPVVSAIVDGVTKISQIPFTSTEHKQAENFRKLLLAMSNDVRVILVKLADRLHNMRTLQYLESDKRIRIARETMEIYAPIGNRLGMGKIKGELEDLAFSYLEPEKYREMIGIIENRRASGEKFLQVAENRMRELTRDLDFPVEFQSRIKRVYSVYAKMQRQEIPFEQVYDFLALRIITESIPQCYAILGIVHNNWRLVPGRFKDYIGMPRPNGYQSVHTTVMSDNGIPFEIQIRTRDMHRVAERGIAAHWRYKEGRYTEDDADQRFTWLRHLLEWQKEVDDPHEFITNLKFDLYPQEVYIFTPRGDVVTLPKGATPLDFAYSIHTEIGNHCFQTRVNGRVVPLRYELHNGEVVEILTDDQRWPSRDWLTFVKTTRARNKIRQWLKKKEKDDSIRVGEQILSAEAQKMKKGLKAVTGHPEFDTLLQVEGLKNLEDLYSQLGFGKLSARRFLELLFDGRMAPEAAGGDSAGIREKVSNVFRRKGGKFVVDGLDNTLVRRARCCNPIPGQEIVGYLTPGRGVVVHTRTCPRLELYSPGPEQLVDVSWGKMGKDDYFTIQMLIYTGDRKGLIADISNRISKTDVNIRDFRAQSTEEHQGVFRITVDVRDLKQLDKVIRLIKSLKDVHDVVRVQKNR